MKAHVRTPLASVRPPISRGRAGRVAAATLAVVAGVLALGSTSALAFSQRGHTLGFTFGTAGAARGQFAAGVGPAGVAVSETTGDVYVVDPGNSRVDQFGPEGEPIAEWGWGVTNGEAKYQVCTLGCQTGTAGTGEGQFDYPKLHAKGTERAAIAIAVDNSAGSPSKGDVYVVSDTATEPNVVQKFGPNGELVNKVKTTAPFVGGLAVDGSGLLWVEAGESEFRLEPPEHFSNAVENLPLALVEFAGNEFGVVECGAPGFAVDAKGETIYYDHERLSVEHELCTPEEEEVIKEEKKERKENGEPEPTRKPVQTVVTAKYHFSGTPPAELITPALDHEYTTNVAVDQSTAQTFSGNAYLDNGTSVAVFTGAGAFVQRFGEKQLLGGTGIGVNGAPVEGGKGGGDVYVGDWKKARVDVFEPEKEAAPTVDSISARDIEPTKTELTAEIDPHGLATEYVFEYGTSDCAAPGANCTQVKGTIPAGFGDKLVSSGEITGLAPATKYFYRVIAKNTAGASESAQTLHTFTTLPQASGLLPDHRAWEMVSPQNKNGATLEAIGGVGSKGAPSIGLIQASEEGTRLAYSANTAPEHTVEGNRAPEAQQIIAQRGEHWTSKDIQTPEARGVGLTAGQPEEYRAFSNDLSLGLLRPVGFEGSKLEEPALINEGENRNLFLRKNFEPLCEGGKGSCFEPLVNTTNSATPEFGTEFDFVGSSPDLNHVIFRASEATPLIAGKPAKSLYEWNAGEEHLKLVDVLPNGTSEEQYEGFPPGLGAERGEQVRDARNAVSEDGSRVFWTGGSEVYMRDMVGGRTLDVSAAEPEVTAVDAETPVRNAVFEGASAKGEVVFFTDTAPLTHEAMLSQHQRAANEDQHPSNDLYACRIIESGGNLKCQLKDLTVDVRANIGEETQLTPLVLGTSSDGTYAYFVAGGSLAHEAKAGLCEGEEKESEDTCNLYVEHYNAEVGKEEWEEPKLIARLSEEDSADWGSGITTLEKVSSRASPNGHYFAFMSNRSLTGYNNEDSATHVRDEEVFIYDAIHETVTCVSCNSNGEKPVGVLDAEQTREGNGLLVDRPEAWLGKTLAGSLPSWTGINQKTALYQSRFLDDEGRLFFDSPEELVKLPEGEKFEHQENVYEYEPQGAGGALGTCASSNGCVALLSSGTSNRESAFIDASKDGSNAFFLTAARLVVSDQDESLDVYDARTCSAESPCLSGGEAAPRPCETSKTCHGEYLAPNGFEGSPLGGTGNVSKVINREEPSSTKKTVVKKPTNAELLKAALKKCHKIKKHKKRAACERSARKKYAAKKASHHSRSHR